MSDRLRKPNINSGKQVTVKTHHNFSLFFIIFLILFKRNQAIWETWYCSHGWNSEKRDLKCWLLSALALETNHVYVSLSCKVLYFSTVGLLKLFYYFCRPSEEVGQVVDTSGVIICSCGKWEIQKLESVLITNQPAHTYTSRNTNLKSSFQSLELWTKRFSLRKVFADHVFVHLCFVRSVFHPQKKLQGNNKNTLHVTLLSVKTSHKRDSLVTVAGSSSRKVYSTWAFLSR